MNSIRNAILLALALSISMIGCGPKDESPTAAAIAADPAGMWVGSKSTSGTDVNIQPDGTLEWTRSGGKVNGKWTSTSAGKIEIDLDGAKKSYTFARDGLDFTLTGDDGSVLTFTQM